MLLAPLAVVAAALVQGEKELAMWTTAVAKAFFRLPNVLSFL